MRLLYKPDPAVEGGSPVVPTENPPAENPKQIEALKKKVADLTARLDSCREAYDLLVATSKHDQDEIAGLQLKVEEMTGQLGKYDTANAARSEREKLIARKMGMNLTREQAIAVIDRQAAHDVMEKRISDKLAAHKGDEKYTRFTAIAEITAEDKPKA